MSTSVSVFNGTITDSIAFLRVSSSEILLLSWSHFFFSSSSCTFNACFPIKGTLKISGLIALATRFWYRIHSLVIDTGYFLRSSYRSHSITFPRTILIYLRAYLFLEVTTDASVPSGTSSYCSIFCVLIRPTPKTFFSLRSLS